MRHVLVCVFVPWVRTQQLLTPQVFRSSGYAMQPSLFAAYSAVIAGAYLATALQAGFVKDMSAGRGYIALAALIFAKWRPWYALYACLLFGFLQALALRPDVIEGALGFKVNAQLLDVLPYILTVIILAGFVGKAIPPRAGGEPYVKER